MSRQGHGLTEFEARRSVGAASAAGPKVARREGIVRSSCDTTKSVPTASIGPAPMQQRFTDSRLAPLNTEGGFTDGGMRQALCEALEPDEVAIASYSVSAHVWVQAVLTDRALLLVKGAVRAKVLRVPLLLEVARRPRGSKKGVRVRTPIGLKTLWGSKLDTDARLLLDAIDLASTTTDRVNAPHARQSGPSDGLLHDAGIEAEWPTRRQRRQAAGPKPRRPRRRRVRKTWVGFAPPSMIWDLADNCVKCGRPLTDPRSRQARVGTKCIRVYGSQQRKIPNPQHAAWIAKKTKAEVTYTAAKVRADAEYARAMSAYEEARTEWARIRSGR